MRYIFGAFTVMLLSACSTAQLPIGATDANILGSSQRSMVMQEYARSLIYVVGGTVFPVQVLTYPRGKQVGYLGVFGFYICSDSTGNIFVAGEEGLGYVWVFPHGAGAPSATLYDPQAPGGCAVDASSGRLAVADTDASPIVVFPYKAKRGWKPALQYRDSGLRVSIYCAYDSAGNLFVDGYDAAQSFSLVELPKGSSTFTKITLDQDIGGPGSLQWDGNYLAVEDAGTSRSSTAVIYRFAISGSNGTTVSTTTLTDSKGAGQFVIHGNTVIGPLESQGIGFWSFPSGGAPLTMISTYISPTGEALSLK